MTNTRKNQSIAFTPTTEQDLLELSDAFSTNVESANPKEVSDDFLVATVLGLKLNELESTDSLVSNMVFTEFALRRANACGAEHQDENTEIRLANRGAQSSAGNTLTVHGIVYETYAEILERAKAVKELNDALLELAETDSLENHNAAWRLVAGQSDQIVIDYCIWAYMKPCRKESLERANQTEKFVKELISRGTA